MEVQVERTSARSGFEIRGVADELQFCIQSCINCAQVCEQMIQYCLEQGGELANVRHVRCMQDCADICATTSRFLVRQSPKHQQLAMLCGDMCAGCAEACDDYNDAMLSSCAEIMRGCAEVCRDLSRLN